MKIGIIPVNVGYTAVDQFVAVVGPMRRWQRLGPRSCRDLSAVMTAGVCGV